MNKWIALPMLVMALLVSSLACQVAINAPGAGTRGSGNVVQEERQISGIRSVSLSNQGDLFIDIGDEERLVIEAEDNLLEYIESSVSNGRLEIGTRGSMELRNRRPIKYYLTVMSLEGLAVTSSGDINAPELEATSFSIDVSSSGDVTLAGLTTDRLEVDISSSGDVRVDGGTATDQDVTVSSSGNYNARSLQSQTANIELSSSGDATVSVSDTLDVQLSSSGDLYYSGDPQVDAQTSSSGDVIKQD